MEIDPTTTAVVLIEYQNDFASEGGALHDAVKDVMAETGMLDNTRRLVDQDRSAGATIIHASRSRSRPATASWATRRRCSES